MARETLAVYASCQVYLERFLGYVNIKKNIGYDVLGFTDLDILREHLRKEKIKAVLFSSEDCSGKVCDGILPEVFDECDFVMILGEQQAALKEFMQRLQHSDRDRVRFIDKYQSAENILNQIGEVMENPGQMPEDADTGGNVNLAGIYSPADKASHPEAALEIYKKLKREHGNLRVLYINLEQFPGLGKMLDYPKDPCITDIIYVYKTNKRKLRETINSTKGSLCGMDVFTAPADPADLEELGRKGWPDFLTELCRAGSYQWIILDLSVYYSFMAEMIFKCGNLYIPALPHEEGWTGRQVLRHRSGERRTDTDRSEDKLTEFRNYLIASGFERYLSRILEVQIGTD